MSKNSLRVIKFVDYNRSRLDDMVALDWKEGSLALKDTDLVVSEGNRFLNSGEN
jgi:hypothetical protein